VRKLRRRYHELGLDALNRHWGGGRSAMYDPAQRDRIIQAARSSLDCPSRSGRSSAWLSM
jgi:hypothetical protein